jgi:hypothetical protein
MNNLARLKKEIREVLLPGLASTADLWLARGYGQDYDARVR